jgi:hypothetical protein
MTQRKKDKHPCPERDSNPRSQCPSDEAHAPEITASVTGKKDIQSQKLREDKLN